MEKGPEPQTSHESAEETDIFQYFVPDGVLRSEPDATLSAFAQLAALRLNAKRALISLLGSENQYVLVEATQSSRLRPDRPGADEDEGFLIGRQILARSLGLCGSALDTLSSQEAGHARGKLWRPPSSPLVVDDVPVDERFRNHPFVTSHPSVRFYTAMPISTTSGLPLGTIAVMDDRPREGLSRDEMEFLSDVAPTIVAHLEVTSVNEGHRRSKKMIRGLGVFMECRTNLNDWWRELRHDPPPVRLRDDTSARPEAEGREEGDAHDRPASRGDADLSRSEPTTAEFAGGLPVADKLLVTTPMAYATDAAAVPSPAGRQSTPLAPPGPPAQPGLGPPATEGRVESFPPSRGQSSRTFTPDLKSDHMSGKLKEMFSCAGRIIQEAIDVDGALFLDARVSTPSERSESVTSTETGGLSRSSTGDSASQGHDAGRRPGEQAPCGILSLWTSEHSSLHGDGSSDLAPLTETLLRTLLHRYPQGHIFSPGEGGAVAHHKKEKQRSRKWPEQSGAEALGTMLPGARSIAFVPLWDANGARWFAACFMWTIGSTGRVLTSGGDLNYLTAFGNSIMAEVARLDVEGTDRAKSDFISSISHELRSPLHGILASAELLLDTSVDLFQHGMIDTIERCGRTLLDTIQHVLDFAKINNFSKGRPAHGRRASRWDNASLSVDVNLSLLAEDVVNSVFVGHELQSRGNPWPFTADEASGFPLAGLRRSSVASARCRRAQSDDETNKERVEVILDVDWRPNWVFRTESGALRRVLMNLFGNALKYTDRGWVRVSLQASDVGSAPGQPAKSAITITVADTGRGIAQEYLHGGLFTPFTQENPLNQGTGLGLSIVLQIARSLRGRISITSEQGVGTEVVVKLILNQVPPSDPRHRASKSQEAVRGARDKTEGLKVGLLGFGRLPASRPGDGQANPESSLPLLLASIENAATQWFGMEVAPPAMWTSSPPDIYIANKCAGIQNALPGVPVIALCSHEELHREYGLTKTQGDRHARPELVHFVTKPCGPHKLAEAFAFCLGNASHSVRAASSTGAPSSNLGSPQSLFKEIPDEYLHGNIEYRSQDSYVSSTAESYTTYAAADSFVSRKQKPKLLLVEDNHINLHLLSTFVQRCGFDYDTAEDGIKAVQTFEAAEKSHNIIIMDITMPVMDGMEATREIRKLEHTRQQRHAMIIALTGLGSANSQKDAFDSGVDMFMTKPVRLKDLRQILDDWAPDKA